MLIVEKNKRLILIQRNYWLFFFLLCLCSFETDIAPEKVTLALFGHKTAINQYDEKKKRFIQTTERKSINRHFSYSVDILQSKDDRKVMTVEQCERLVQKKNNSSNDLVICCTFVRYDCI